MTAQPTSSFFPSSVGGGAAEGAGPSRSAPASGLSRHSTFSLHPSAFLAHTTHPGAVRRTVQTVEYEDLLGLWGDLETALAMLLAHPAQVRDFSAKVRQLDMWLQELVAHDVDAALYLMFQLAATSSTGYSASHALVCATLCHLMALELALPGHERNALVRAALTMNIAMAALQDELAEQREKPTPAQQRDIDSHPLRSQALLEQLQVIDDLWLDTVALHHGAEATAERSTLALAGMAAPTRLARILATIDRYAAMISPRRSRPGRSATASVRAVVGQVAQERDEVGFALVRSIGLCPPGTFVRLDNGHTAIVLRRSKQANLPLVASLLDRTGAFLSEPRLHHTARGKPLIESALARSQVQTGLNHRTMVRLGLYAAGRSTPLVSHRGGL